MTETERIRGIEDSRIQGKNVINEKRNKPDKPEKPEGG